MKLIHFIAGALASALVAFSTASAQTKLQAFDKSDPSSERLIDHSAWDAFLKTYIKPRADGLNLVDYGAVTGADKAALKSYLTALQGEDPTALNRDESFVYWINLYNALTIDVILDNYPVKSIRNIRSGLRAGPWLRDIAEINGVAISLDNIEHGILRAFWDENRVHYAVNCASIGCPNLLNRAWLAEDLEETLTASARAYVNHPRGFTVASNGRSTASSIYNWFKEDFGGDDAGVIKHMLQFADPETAEKLKKINKIDRFDYDWGLNDAN